MTTPELIAAEQDFFIEAVAELGEKTDPRQRSRFRPNRPENEDRPTCRVSESRKGNVSRSSFKQQIGIRGMYQAMLTRSAIHAAYPY